MHIHAFARNQRALIFRLYEQGTATSGGTLSATKKFIHNVRWNKYRKMRLLGRMLSFRMKRPF